jgi:hypothetical protein
VEQEAAWWWCAASAWSWLAAAQGSSWCDPASVSSSHDAPASPLPA